MYYVGDYIMHCSKCGAELRKDAQFCGSCGTKIYIENGSNIGIDEAVSCVKKDVEKYTVNEILEKIGNFITLGLSIISVIVLIGGFLGFFDEKPIPMLIFLGVVGLFEWIEDKLPKVPSIVFAVLEIIVLIMCFNIANDIGAIDSVKGGSPESYPNITYERAFEDYFSDTTWKSVGKDEDGNEVVKFTGNCYYLDETAVVEIKFTIYEEQGIFVVSSVKINGTDMGILGNALIMDIFEEYKQSHK